MIVNHKNLGFLVMHTCCQCHGALLQKENSKHKQLLDYCGNVTLQRIKKHILSFIFLDPWH